jgi:hypothetical protein
MNKFIQHEIFDIEQFTESLTNLNSNTREFYGDWILELRRGKTFFLLNVNWQGNSQKIPDDYDRYVFSFHVEPWDHQWIKDFCESHSDQEVVVISEYPLNDQYYALPNLQVLVYHCWAWLIPKVLEYDRNHYKISSTRSRHLSSLTNKPSFFKSLTTGYIYGHQLKNRAIMSWNINKRQDICSSMKYLDISYDYPSEIKELIEFYHENLKHLSIPLDDFDDTRFSNYFSEIPAFTQCLVNVSNETYQTTVQTDHVMTGPFLTEKTWKPLLAGCALIPQGMPNTYSYLEKFGFIFDYPWDKEFDQQIPDFTRYLGVLQTIDLVLKSDFYSLAYSVEHSNRYNFEHIRSKDFIDRVKSINQTSLENFLSK